MSEVRIGSYGSKYGNPDEFNYKFDVSFIRNPARDPSFKGQTGTSQEMKDYIMADPIANQQADAIVDFIVKTHNYNAMSIGLHCTGGRHRSVTMVEEVAKRLKKYRIHAKTFHLHKDIAKKVY